MDWAQEADDPLMISYVLMRKSNQASTAADAPRTLGLARAALRDRDRLTPRARALVLRQEARGHALNRDAAPCARALDDAAEQVFLHEDHGPDEQALTSYCTPEYIEMEAADCAMTLGQPGQAVAIFEHGLSTWSADYQRDRGLNLARLSTAHAANHDPERACAAARDAVTIAADTGSARTIALLHRLPARLTRWSDLPAVADLRHALAALP